MPASRALPLPFACRSLWAVALLSATLASPTALAQPAGWTPLGGPEAGTVTDLAPAAGGRVWAATDTAGLFRSDDGAAHWNRVERGPIPGHEGSGFGLDPSWVRGEIQAIVASPTDPDIAYAAIRHSVLRTEDGGATWEPTGLSGNIEVMAISPSDPDVVYLSNRRQVWRTDNGGDTWRQADRGLEVGYLYSLTVDPHDPLTVYAAAGSGSHRSTDGGQSWVAGQGLPFVELVRIAVDPDNPAVLYGAERFDNVWKSVDQGLSWTRLAAFANSPNLTDLEFDPFSPGTLFLTANGGGGGAPGPRPTGRVLRSLDRGVTWTPVLTTELIHDLDFDPQRPGRAYLATDVLGVFKTEDSGATWAPANDGLTAALVFRLTPDPHTQGTLYAVVTSFRKEIFEPGSLGIWKSTDGGVNWSPINAGLEGLGGAGGNLPVVREVVADPQKPGVLYAVTAAGLFKSTNGGASWLRTDGGSPLQPASDLAIDPRNSDVLYAAANGGTGTAAAAKSTDGGQTWTPLSGPRGPFQVVEVDLWNPSTVYLAGNGLWRSDDDGASWTEVPGAPWDWTRLVTGPAPGSLYGLASFALLGSADRGDNWLRVQLPVDDPSQNSIFDLWHGPAAASPVFAATNSGIYRLTANNTWLQLGGDFWAFSVTADPFQAGRAYAGTRDGLVLGFGSGVGGGGGECADTATALCLEDRFLVEVTWELPGGSQMAARARPVAAASGSFWFFDPDLAEVVVKIVDGRPLNQHFWFFANGMTSLTYTVRVTDTTTGDSQLYGSPEGQFLSIADTRAFLEPGPPPPASLSLPSQKAGSILLASRFRAELSWKLGDRSGTAEAVSLGANSAGFWIFDPDHLEAAVKLFDGRPVNGHFWVFFTNLTSVELTLTVTDTETGQEKVYRKPPGLTPGQVDPEAF